MHLRVMVYPFRAGLLTLFMDIYYNSTSISVEFSSFLIFYRQGNVSKYSIYSTSFLFFLLLLFWLLERCYSLHFWIFSPGRPQCCSFSPYTNLSPFLFLRRRIALLLIFVHHILTVFMGYSLTFFLVFSRIYFSFTFFIEPLLVSGFLRSS